MIAVAVLGVVGFALGWITCGDDPPFDPGLRLDRTALALGLLATVLPFVALAGTAAGVVVYLAGRAWPEEPDLERWLAGEGTAVSSPPVVAALRDEE